MDKTAYKDWADKLNGAKNFKRFTYWSEQCKKIEARFDNIDYEENKTATKLEPKKFGYNLLWSNFKTIMPYLCPYIPTVLVDREDKDENFPAITASEMLQRCIQKTLEENEFKAEMYRVKTDYILAGRGVVWNRYISSIKEVEKTYVDELGQEQVLTDEDGKPLMEEVLDSESVEIEYVNREDILHNNARTWGEVEWIAKRSYLNEEDFKEKFGDNFKDYISEDKEDKSSSKKAEVWEIWDKENKKVLWFSFASDKENLPDSVLDEEDDFLGLKGFFPCPEFLTSTVSNSSIIPTPDYSEVESQYEMLDTLTNKLYKLMEMVKVQGLYAGDKNDIPKLLTKNDENVLVATSNWNELMNVGGLKGAIEWLPLETIIKALVSTIEAMDKVNSDIQRLLGIPNIMEGQTNAQEAWKTNKAKGRYGTMRIQERQDKIQTFIKKECELLGELISEHFDEETLVDMSGILKTPNSQYTQEAVQLLKDEEQRDYQIDIETEGTQGYYDEEQAMKNLAFFNNSIDALVKAGQVVDSEPTAFGVVRLLLEDLTRQTRKGRNFESELKTTLDKVEQQLSQPKPEPQPDPNEVLKSQTTLQTVQAKGQVDIQKEQIKQQGDMQKEMLKGNIEGKKNESEVIEKAKDRALDSQLAQVDNAIAEADLIIKDKKVDGDLLLGNKELEYEMAGNLINQANNNDNMDTNLGS